MQRLIPAPANYKKVNNMNLQSAIKFALASIALSGVMTTTVMAAEDGKALYASKLCMMSHVNYHVETGHVTSIKVYTITYPLLKINKNDCAWRTYAQLFGR